MELAHLPYQMETYEDYVGDSRTEAVWQKRGRRQIVDVMERLIATLKPADVVPRRRHRERIHRRISSEGTCRWRATTCEEGPSLMREKRRTAMD